MKVLVIGSGGREHALAWKLSMSPSVTEVITAPGNAGTWKFGRNVDLSVTDVLGICRLAKDEKPALIVIGPEAPLCIGLADRLREDGHIVFGPGRAGAELEGSKAVAKELMVRQGIPTASHKTFTDQDQALEHLREDCVFPVVLKASGLAAGKGVLICQSLEEAEEGIQQLMGARAFGDSGATVVIEDFVSGREASIHCLTDGSTLHPLPTSMDHKRAFDGDEGPNTGGMGAVSPCPHLEDKMLRRVEQEILFPTVHALREVKRPFSGVLYAGLMMNRGGPKVLEYNVRFGDPETQVLLPRMKGDLFELMTLTATGKLAEIDDAQLAVDPRVAVTVVLAADQYPAGNRRGDTIEGVEDAERLPGVTVFHSGTMMVANRAVSAGGRILTVTALGKTQAEARRQAYEAVGRIHFDGMRYRTDIGGRD